MGSSVRSGRASCVTALVASAFVAAVIVGRASRADDAGAPPTAEHVDSDEKAGRVAEALDGWTARYLGSTATADRSAALKRYIALAGKNPADADPWLVDAVARSGAGISIVAGRRVVLVAQTDSLGGADPARVAALLDATALAVERLVGVRPPVVKLPQEDKRQRDRAGRFLVGTWGLPKPAADQVFDEGIGRPDEKSRGLALCYAVAGACGGAAVRAAPNRRARLLDPATTFVVRDLAVREVGEAGSVARADEFRARAAERYVAEWAPGCLPGEWIPTEEPLAQLFFVGLEFERAGGHDPFDLMHAYLTAARPDPGWGGRRVASRHDLGMEAVAASFPPGFVEGFRRAGVMPVGRALEEMKLRADVDKACRDADALRGGEARATAARMLHDAADQLHGAIAADELTIDALELEEKDDPKKARAAAKKLSLIEGFEFLGPMPALRPKDEAPVASRLLPFAVSTAEGRRPVKLKEPMDVSLKWGDVKDSYDHLVERTPWGDKRGLTWGGATVAAVKWTKDMGRALRLRPCRTDGAGCVTLCDGRVVDPWPDGSVLVSGAKGTEIVLAGPERLTCSAPWRDAKSVDADVAAAVAESDPILALRPWAARRVAAVLPAVVDALCKESDADFARDVLLLAPYHGGDAAACDAVLAHLHGRVAPLAAYLDVCRGTRDVAVLDKLVALGAAADAKPEIAAGVQALVEGALLKAATEKGADLAAAWDRGKKWLGSAAFVEAEDMRDLYDDSPCFRVLADAGAWGRACVAPSGRNNRRGEGYLCLDVPEGSGDAFLTLRWRPVAGGRLSLHGYFADGKKQRPFAIDLPAVADEPRWTIDVFPLGPIPRGRIVVAVDDPCAAGYKLDALAVGAKPAE